MTEARGLTCQEVTELVTDYLERALPPDELARLDAHLVLCEGCKNHVEQVRVTIATVRGLRVRESGAGAAADLLDAFRASRRRDPPPGDGRAG